MNPGKLRFRFDVQEQVEAIDDIGGVRDDWRTRATVWGDMLPLSGREDLLAKQMNAELKHKIRLRYMPDFNPNWRLRLDGTARLFYPTSTPDVHARHREMLLLVTETLEGETGGTI
jgi:SPP1 family predicted phage head-tail adaptor